MLKFSCQHEVLFEHRRQYGHHRVYRRPQRAVSQQQLSLSMKQSVNDITNIKFLFSRHCF